MCVGACVLDLVCVQTTDAALTLIPTPPHRHIPIDELSVGQFSVIRKLCLLRLTAMLEMYNPNNKIGPSLWV